VAEPAAPSESKADREALLALERRNAELRARLAATEQRLATAEAMVERGRRLEAQFSWEIVE
jgi:hypothetical protein